MSTDTQTFNDLLGKSPFSSNLGITVESLGENSAVCSLPVTEEVLNSYGTLHGGVHYSLADSTVAVALLHALNSEAHVATIEGKINYVASIESQSVDKIFAKADIDHVGSSTAVVSVDVTDEIDQLLCKCLFTFTVGR
ncbi:MAG: PaaI family thioesterase [bacterium]